MVKEAGAPTRGKGKKMFYLSQSYDSEDDHSGSASARSHVSPPALPPPAERPRKAEPAPQAEKDEDDDEDWEEDDDEDGDDDDASSSGWGSDYSTESEPQDGVTQRDRGTAKQPPQKKDDGLAFSKRAPSEASLAMLKPRGPGLLSQLFHPDLKSELRPGSAAPGGGHSRNASSTTLLDENSRPTAPSPARLGAPPMHAAVGAARGRLLQSQSATMLSEANRSKSFLKGKPQDVELESSSDEDEGDKRPAPRERSESSSKSARFELPTTASGSVTQATGEDDYTSKAQAALTRLHERSQQQATAQQQLQNFAPAQTPRTTRRTMLQSELSDSLRKNLLWERQTRNKALRIGLKAPDPPTPPIVGSAPGSQESSKVTIGFAGKDWTDTQPKKHHAPRLGPPRSGESRSRRPSREGKSPEGGPASTSGEGDGGAILPRRHTTGHGLYLEAQRDGYFSMQRSPGESDSDSDSSSAPSSPSSSEDEGEATAGGLKVPQAPKTYTTAQAIKMKRKDLYPQMAFSHGLHSHGW